MFRGWLSLGGAEIANTSRLLAHANPAPSTDLILAQAQCTALCRVDFMRYDDSWPGLRAYLGDSAYDITNAPWYDVAIPQSAEFLGIWVMKVDGDGPVPVSRTINDAICPGGIASPHRDAARTVTVEALLIGCSNPGVVYGLEWLSCQLGAAKEYAGTTLDFLSAHPENSAAVATTLRRTMNRVVLTREATISNRFNSGGPNRQGSMMAIDWEMGVLDPYTYGPATAGTITWDTSVTESITWAHPPTCADPSSCDDIPILSSVTCVPNVIDIEPAPPPVCAGCVPVCSVQTRTFQLPEASGVFCRDEVYSFTITAGAGNDVSANFWLRPCGSTDICDRGNFLSLAGLPAGATVTVDSILGQPYGVVAGERVRQVGIVYTPSGAPWSPAIVDAALCWELVVQHEPGLVFTVQYSVRGRSA
jgi:hypothetical protein